MQYRIEPPPMNPLSRLLAGVVALLALVGAFFFGIFILAVVVALAMIAWLVIWIRIWWLKRRLGAAAETPAGGGQARNGSAQGPVIDGEVIDGEYEVVTREDER